MKPKSYGTSDPKVVKAVRKKKSPAEDSVFFQPAKQGNKKYRHLIPGSHYNLTGIGKKNKISKGK